MRFVQQGHALIFLLKTIWIIRTLLLCKYLQLKISLSYLIAPKFFEVIKLVAFCKLKFIKHCSSFANDINEKKLKETK